MQVKVFELIRARSLKVGMKYRHIGSDFSYEVLEVVQHKASCFPNLDGWCTVFNTDGSHRIFNSDDHVEVLTGCL